MFLQPTIDSLIERAEGEIEVIAVIDGDWPKIPIKNDPHVILIHHFKRGMRNAINEAARIAKGKYIMKCDGHCLFDKGFDVKLAEDCEPNWLSVPTRYSLEPEKWEKKTGKAAINAMFITPPNKRPSDAGRFWETGFTGVTWRDKENDKLIEDLMTFQGSCWFMHRDLFFKIECMDDKNCGTFAKEAQELGNKVWLSGGRVIRNKKTWYAHLHKGKKYGRGYFISRKEIQKSSEFIASYWIENKWSGQTRDFKWLIDHFAPVPGWENYEW
jgi:glycosyltransferase involved in cell wall biosynthesis